MSLKNSILYLIKSQGEVSYDEIYSLAEEMSHRPDNASRRCRELSNAGLIEPIKQRTKDGTLFINGYRSCG